MWRLIQLTSNKNVVAEMLSAGVATGELRDMPVQVFMTMAFGSIVTFARQKSDKVEHEAEFEQLYDMLWAAMRKESHEED